MKRERLDALLLYQGGLLLILAVLSAAASFWFLLGQPGGRSLGDRIILSGLAGTFGSCVGPLLTGSFNATGQATTRGGRASIGALAPLLYGALGFGAAGSGFVVVVALLLGPGLIPEGPGTATFGAIIGLGTARTLARWIGGSGSAGATGDRPGSPALLDTFGLIEQEVLDRVSGRFLVDYDGLMLMGWYPQSNLDRQIDRDYMQTIGRIRVAFIPRSREAYIKNLSDALRLEPDEAEPAIVNRARIRVTGSVEDVAPFTVEINSGDTEIVPRRVEIPAPTSRASKPIEFQVVRLPPSSRVFREDKGSDEDRRPDKDRAQDVLHLTGWPFAPASSSIREADVFIVDVSQRGTTVQLAELDTAFADLSGGDKPPAK
jgi:hypothetical protein